MTTITHTPPTRPRAEIETEIAAARARLASRVEQLVEEVHPKAIAARTVDGAKARAASEFAAAKRQIKDEAGWRTDRIVVLSAAVGGLAAFALIIQGLVGRRRRRR